MALDQRLSRIFTAAAGLLLLASGCAAGGGTAEENVEAAEQSLTTVYEVEAAVVSGPKVLSSFSGFTGTGYADYQAPSGEFVEWTVQVANAGQYRLAIRYANGATASRSLQLQANGDVVTNALAFAPTGAWDKWSTATLTTTLKAGSNKLRAASTGSSGPNVDNLTVSDVPPFDATLEAEAALISGPIVGKVHGGFTGTGYTDYQASSGEFIEWTVTAPAAGSYSLGFRYSNGGAASRPLSVQVNGALVNSSLAFPPTGAWGTWATAAMTATLKSGTNKVRASSTGSSGADLDHLRVTSQVDGTALIIDSGEFTPISPEQGIAFDRTTSMALPVSLTAPTRLDSTEVYLAMFGSASRTVRAALYRDSVVSGGLPKGSPIFSKKIALPTGFTKGWLSISGLGWDVPAGSYWIAFESDEASGASSLTFPRGKWSNLPSRQATWLEYNGDYWSIWSPPGAIDGIGVRLRASTSVPTTVALIDSGEFAPISPEQGIAFDRTTSMALPVSLTAPTRLDSTEVYLAMFGSASRTVRAALYRDSVVSGGLPKGSPIFSKKIALPTGFTKGWLSISGLGWDVPAGSYWIAFESDEASGASSLTFPRGKWSNLPSRQATWLEYNGDYWSIWSPPGAIDGIGVRLRASTSVPTTVALIDSGEFAPISPEQGIAFDRTTSMALPVSLTAPTRLDSTEVYLAMFGSASRTVRAALYRDSVVSGGLPKGSPIFSKKIALPTGFTKGWLSISGLGWDVPAGSYWIAFESDEASGASSLTFPRGKWSNLPSRQATWLEYNGDYWSIWSPPGAIDGIGVRLRASTSVPTTVALIDSGEFAPISPEQGIAFDRTTSMALPVSLTAPTRLDSTEVYLAMFGSASRTVRAALYRDSVVSGGLPKGSPIFSKKIALPTGFTKGWLSISGLGWDVPAGSYWIAFESDEASGASSLTFPRGKWSNLPSRQATWLEYNGDYWSIWSPPGAIDGIGVRLRASTSVPTTVALIDSGEFAPISPEQGIAFDRTTSMALPVSLTAPTRLDSTEVYLAMFGSASRTVRAALYRDSVVSGGLPKGSPIFSKKIALPTGFTKGWLSISGLGWDVPAGSYWIAFESDEASGASSLTFPRGKWSNLPSRQATWLEYNGDYWSIWSPPGAIDGIGVRLRASTVKL